MGIKVYFGEKISQELVYLPDEDLQKIISFKNHLEANGFTGLTGRNKKSDEVPTDDPNWLEKVKYAQENNLWHYHIGIPCYDEYRPTGDQTSEYLLHYIREENAIKIVDLSAHPPFRLPSESYLK